MAASTSHMLGNSTNDDINHEQSYLMAELESLGLSTIQLNEFNNNSELRHLVRRIKQNKSSSSSLSKTKKKDVAESKCIEELRSLGIKLKTTRKVLSKGSEQELSDILHIIKYSLYNAYKKSYAAF